MKWRKIMGECPSIVKTLAADALHNTLFYASLRHLNYNLFFIQKG